MLRASGMATSFDSRRFGQAWRYAPKFSELIAGIIRCGRTTSWTLLACCLVIAPPTATADEPLRFLTGQRNVKAILVDEPEVWIGTSGGVIRYDQTTDSHKVYGNKNGLLSNGIFHLGKIREEIWIGTYGGGLSLLDPVTENFRHYNVPEGLGDAFVYDVLEVSNGDIWIATWSGANLIRGGRMDEAESWDLFTVENTGGGLPNDWVYGLAEGPDGAIWLATEGGLAHYDGDVWRNWDHADGLGAPYELVEKSIQFKSDPATQSGHHARQKQDQQLEDVNVAYNPNYVVGLAIDADGVVWAGTWGAGLSRFDGETWSTYTIRDGLPANHVFMLEIDPEGRLWIGTSEGLARYDGRKFIRYTQQHGLVSNNVFSMAFAPDGSAWVGSYGGVTGFQPGF